MEAIAAGAGQGSQRISSSSNRFEETGRDVEEAMRTLDRHHQRRQQDVPTLSVMLGGASAASIVCRWTAAKGCTVATASAPVALDAIRRWFDTLTETHDLTAAAYTWLARRIGGDADKLAISQSRRSTHEQELFLHRLFSGATTSPADLVCRVLIEHSCESGSVASSAWDRLQTAFKDDMGGLCGGIVALLDANRPPLLYVTLSSTASIEQLRSFFDNLAVVVCASPRLNIVVSIDGVALAGYLAGTPECRSLALVREGMIALAPELSIPLAPTRGPIAAVLESELLGTRVSSWGDLPRSSTLDDVATLRRDDPARSAAERYLFERLQTHPETAGLFELNGHLDCGGKGTMEIDLLARGARVAVEIDGYYHFHDPEAYRRDRRKDMQLQHAGYFVVRCLADDVVSRLEEIFESILAAVRRRGRAGEGG